MSNERVILIASLNAAVDHIVSVERLEAGRVHRTADVYAQAGGKAINVARALTALGHRVHVVALVGGFTGQQISADLAKSGIPATLLPISGSSRNCYIMVDRSSRAQTVVNEVGPQIEPAEYERFCHELSTRIDAAEMLICSGSLPRGVEAGCYRRFIELAHARALPTLVDATGDALRLALEARPLLAKPNRDEAEQLLGRRINDGDALEAARAIRTCGAEVGLLSLGASGAAAVWADGELLLPAPTLSVVNSVASGDAFLAGCAAAIIDGQPVAEMLRWGVAAGSANALVGGARITRVQFEEMRGLTTEAQG